MKEEVKKSKNKKRNEDIDDDLLESDLEEDVLKTSTISDDIRSGLQSHSIEKSPFKQFETQLKKKCNTPLRSMNILGESSQCT